MAPRQRLNSNTDVDSTGSDSTAGISPEDNHNNKKKVFYSKNASSISTTTPPATEADIARDQHDYFNLVALVRWNIYFELESSLENDPKGLVEGALGLEQTALSYRPCLILILIRVNTKTVLLAYLLSTMQLPVIVCWALNYDLEKAMRLEAFQWTGNHFTACFLVRFYWLRFGYALFWTGLVSRTWKAT